MKKWNFLFLMLIVSFSVFAQKPMVETLSNYINNNKEAYVKVNCNSEKEVYLLSQKIAIDKPTNGDVFAYISKNNLSDFLEMNLDFTMETRPSELFVPEMYDGSKEIYDFEHYPTYEAYIAMMEQFAADYPEICQVFSIGNSVEGRELKFVKISDNVSTNEAEAQFLYTGTMHGDETTGFVLLLRLIDYLTTNYGTDEEVTNMVDNLEIWINPAANPDGTYAGGNHTVFGATRANANGVNLNRNYKDAQYGDHPDGNAWQAETVAFMQLAEENNFVMAANTHGGAEVVNYPWDVWSRLSADDEWWQFVSHEYADTAQSFSPSNYMNGFDDGITNGYAWYSISGGRQDYMNYFHHCREVTLEISNVKTIPETQLDAHWTYNKRSLINYMKQAMYGVTGIITDSITGEPLRAKVEILGHDMDESHVYSRESLGNYHRLLKAGTYDITYSADGYIPKTITDVTVVDYDSTLVEVQLVSAALIADFIADQNEIAIGSSVQFTEQCFGGPETYEWTFEGGIPATSNEANPLVQYNEEGVFDVSLTVTSGSDVQTMTKENYIRVSEQYIMGDGEITTCSGMFLDDGGVDGDYSNNKDFTYTIYGSTPVSESILEVEFIEFNVESHDNCDYDYLEIYNGANISSELIGTYCGTDSPGLVQSNNEDNALTFVFHSDNSVVAAGWKAIINCTIIDQIEEVYHDNPLSVYPNPVDNGFLHIELPEFVEQISIYNIAGQLMQTWIGEDKKQMINVAGFDSGVYLLSVQSASSTYHQKIQIK